MAMLLFAQHCQAVLQARARNTHRQLQCSVSTLFTLNPIFPMLPGGGCMPSRPESLPCYGACRRTNRSRKIELWHDQTRGTAPSNARSAGCSSL